MTIPSQPRFLIEGPASACVLGSRQLGWLNCTPLATAMGIDRSTLGRLQLSGCQVRDEIDPPDTIGGTTLRQCAEVAERHGVAVEIHVGSGVCTPQYAAIQCQAGRGFVLQGNTEAIGKTNTNHAIWVNHTGRGVLGAPTSAMVYDPWSSGPAVWSWAKVLAFAAALHPYGEADKRRLGPGKFYCGIFPDTEPHLHTRYGGIATSPFPRPMQATAPVRRRVNVRGGPSTRNPILRTVPRGTVWTAYQVTHGQTLAGSNVWYGSHQGDEWIHSSGLR